MPAPFGHVDVSTLMGSWPVLPDIGTSGAVLQPRTLNERATVLGVARETPSGFAVVGFSFYLWSDNPAGIPTQHNILFSGTGNLTLAQVVSQINVAVTETVAFQDNGFLRLNSPRTGQTSYLRVQTDPSSGPTALVALGLFAETVSKGGSIRQAQHIDPDRQVSLPGQLAWSEGEPFEARVFNRMAFQLAINSDRAGNLLDQKRVAMKKELETVYSAVRQAGGYGEGIQLTGYVYVGDGGTTNPSETRLEKLFAILDNDGNDLVKENQTVVASSTPTGTTYTWDVDLLKQKVAWTAGPPFTSAHVTGDFYIKPSGLTGGPAALNGKLLKITERIDNDTVVVLPVDPVTGIRYQITQASLPSDFVRVDTVRALVTGVYDLPGGSRIENVQRTRQASTPITRVDKNNRIYCAAANFTNPANPTVPGDVVTWSGAVVAQPYSNDGTYRVASVVDKWTLELVAQDWGPVYLNPDDAAYVGDVVVQSDGRFWKDPFLLLKPAPLGALPATTDNIRVIYLGMNTLKSATDDPAAFVGPGVRYVQEVDANITAAILAIIGPSATTINDYLYGDRTKNLEEIFNEFRLEHWVSGRHSTIRPDYINMEPNQSGPTIILRNTATDETNHNNKLTLRNAADNYNLAELNADGYYGSRLTNSYPRSSFWAGYNESLSFEMGPPAPGYFFIGVQTGASSLAADTYYYLVAGVAPDGSYGPTIAAESVAAVVPVSNARYVQVAWNWVPGTSRYVLFRRSASVPGVWQERRTDTFTGTVGNSTFEDFGTGWGAATVDPVALRSSFSATSTQLRAQTRSWIGTPLAVNGGTVDNATFSVRGTNSGVGKVAAFYRGGGQIFQGTGFQGQFAPLMALDMDLGDDPANQHIAKFEFKRWGSPGQWYLYSDLRVTGYINASSYQFRDSGGNVDASITVDSLNGGKVQVFRTPFNSAAYWSSKVYGDAYAMYAENPDVMVKLGIRNAGNWYVDTGAGNYPVVVNTGIGNVAIGFSSMDVTPLVTASLDVNTGLRVANENSSSDSWIRIGGRQTANALSYIDLVSDSSYTTYGTRLIRVGNGSSSTTHLANRGYGNLIISNYGPYDSPYNGEYGNICVMPGVSGGNWKALCVGTTNNDPVQSYFYLRRSIQIMLPGETRYAGHVSMLYSNMLTPPSTGTAVGLYVECDRSGNMDDGVPFTEVCAQRTQATMSTGSGYLDFTVTNFEAHDVVLNAYYSGSTYYTNAHGIKVSMGHSGTATAGQLCGVSVNTPSGSGMAYNWAAFRYAPVTAGAIVGHFATGVDIQSINTDSTGSSYGFRAQSIGNSGALSNMSFGAYLGQIRGYNWGVGAYITGIGAGGSGFMSQAKGIWITGVSNTINVQGSARGLEIEQVAGGGTGGDAIDIYLYTPTVGATTRYLMKHANTAGNWDVAGNFNSASSRDHKTDIRELDYDTAKATFLALSPALFKYKPEFDPVPEGGWKTDFAGFIAEDAPDLVATVDRKSVSPMPYISVLTKIVQRLYQEVETLKEQVAILQAA